MNFDKLTNGVIRCLTEQLNAHIKQYATTNNIPIIWWEGIGGTNGDKKQYILDNYYQTQPFGRNKVLCIRTTREFVKSATVREFDRKSGKGSYSRLYITEKLNIFFVLSSKKYHHFLLLYNNFIAALYDLCLVNNNYKYKVNYVKNYIYYWGQQWNR